jgi:hypothetical protein
MVQLYIDKNMSEKSSNKKILVDTMMTHPKNKKGRFSVNSIQN